MTAQSPQIVVKNIEKVFQGERQALIALQNGSFQVAAGEFVSFVGPSGCGKSTLFNIIAGLLPPTSGEVVLNGENITGKTGHVGYMLQKDLLVPWRTVLGNVVLGAEVLGRSKKQITEEAVSLFPIFGLDGFQNNWPSALSGGMRQRAALMRTMLSHMDIFLLDEPFGALDAMTKMAMQQWLLEIWTKFRRTILFVTHDIDEAIFLSDRIFVMTSRPGMIKQEIVVSLDRPRPYEITTTAEFGEIKHTILEAMRNELTAIYQMKF